VPVQGTVSNTLVDAHGRGLQNVTVTVSLISPNNPFLLDGSGEVLTRVPADTDHTGTWTATLLANSEFEQDNTFYLVDETSAPGGGQWSIRMPDDGVYRLRDLLVYIPPDTNPGGPVVVGAGGGYTFVQSTPDSEWTIPHHLGYRPNIEAYEGMTFDADSDAIEWDQRRDPNPDTTILSYRGGAPLGHAYCS
jgi:hypothetical protein